MILKSFDNIFIMTDFYSLLFDILISLYIFRETLREKRVIR